jgi:hypothetical protein
MNVSWKNVFNMLITQKYVLEYVCGPDKVQPTMKVDRTHRWDMMGSTSLMASTLISML